MSSLVGKLKLLRLQFNFSLGLISLNMTVVAQFRNETEYRRQAAAKNICRIKKDLFVRLSMS